MPTKPPHAHVVPRAKRILGPMASFTLVDALRPEELAALRHCPDYGQLIGVYRNPGPSDEILLVTDAGVAVQIDQHCAFVPFCDVSKLRISSPGSTNLIDTLEKNRADAILIEMRNGQQRFIPVRGGKGNFRDVFEFCRFFLRAVGQ